MEHNLFRQLGNREDDAKKGDNGRVLVIAGSRRFPNTPAIVAGGALRTGIDLLQMAAPEPALQASQSRWLNTTVQPLDGDRFTQKQAETVVAEANDVDAVVIGPGLGRAESTQEAIRAVIRAVETPTVIDADAIHALADETGLLGEQHLLTPHAGEIAVIAGKKVPQDVDARREIVEDLVRETGATVLLKGPTDIIAGSERTETVDAGTPLMARGGTGDVLAGIAAGLVAQTGELFDSAHAAAVVNGTAGERVAEQKGPGFLLEELIEEVTATIHAEE